MSGDKLPVVLGKVSSIMSWLQEKTSDAATCMRKSPKPRASIGGSECEVCGERQTSTIKKVIGGRDAEPGEYPWAALILVDSQYREGLRRKTTRNQI